MTTKSILIGLALICAVSMVSCGCWSEWSRCSKWSSAGTGVLWKSCHDKCRELGKAGGRCVLQKSTCGIIGGPFVWQCKCYDGNFGTTPAGKK